MKSDLFRGTQIPGLFLQVLLLALVYFCTGELGLVFARYQDSPVTLIWPPSGVSLAVLLLGSLRLWPGVWLGSFALALSLGLGWPLALSLSCGNTLQAVAGAHLLGQRGFHPALDRQRDLGLLVFWGAFLASLISTVIDVTSLCLAGRTPWAGFLPTALTWWLGDAVGVLLVAPLVLSWRTLPSARKWPVKRWTEAALVAVSLLATSYLAFTAQPDLHPQQYSLAFLPFPFLIWAALRLGVRGAATCSFLVSSFAILKTAAGEGPFAGNDLQGSVLLWVFISSVASLSLFLSTIWVERRRTEIALRDSEERFRGAFADAPIGMALIGLEGNLQQVNHRFCEMTGYDRNELLHKSFLDITHPDDLKNSMEKLLDVLATGGKIQPFETRYLRKDERAIWVRVSSTPLSDSESRLPLGLIVQVQDVTSDKRAEAERRVLQQQLLQAQKMESLGQMVGGVAHDFNNLMLAVLGYADLSLGFAGLPPTVSEYLHQIRQAGERASELTRKLLTFSRKQTLRSEVIDLSELLSSLMKILNRLIPESIELTWFPSSTLDRVEADPSQLEQVVINLCVNARDAMPRGGRLTLATRNVILTEADVGRSPDARPGSYVLLSVQDEGCGIPPQLLERIFDPFFTTKKPTEGTGLGLAMVYGIIKQHGGWIEVQSQVGQGSTFGIYLPATERTDKPQAVRVDVPTRGGDETLLLAEDEETVRTLARRVLESAGYDVISAENGEQALEIFEQCTDDIALVILDVVMPRLGGRETCERIRASKPDARVLFTSGYTGSELPADFLREHGLLLLPKPYDAATLLRTVRQVLDSDQVMPKSASR